MDKDQEMFFDDDRMDEDDVQESKAIAPSDDSDLSYFLQLLDYLQDAVEFGSSVPLTNKKLVDAEMCLDIIRDLRGNLPPAVQYAQQVIDDRDTILDSAERTAANKLSSAEVRVNAAIDDAGARSQQMIEEAEDRADKIIKDAEIRARAMIDQNAIKVAAQNEAREIVNEARAEANERQLEASAYGENLLHNVERELMRAVDMVRNKRQNLVDN